MLQSLAAEALERRRQTASNMFVVEGNSDARTILCPSAPAAKRSARPSRKVAMTSCSRVALTASGTSSGRWRAAWVFSRSLRVGYGAP